MRNDGLSCNRIAAALIRAQTWSCVGLLAVMSACTATHETGTARRDAGASEGSVRAEELAEHNNTDDDHAEAGVPAESENDARAPDSGADAKGTDSNESGQGSDAKHMPGDMGPSPESPSGDALPDAETPDPSSGTGAAGSGDDPLPPAAGGAPQCEPQGGRFVVLEQEELMVNLRCAIAGAAPSSWTLEVLPPGAEFDTATGTLTWRPGLDQAASYTLTARAMPWEEIATLDIAVVDRVDAEGNQPLADPATYLEEYGLPVLHLNTDPGVNDDAYTPATITYRGHTFTGSEAKFRGATSRWYPKRSFTLKFTKEDKFGDPDRAGGFNEKRKVVLITSFDDNSYVRQRLGYELWNRLDPSGHIRVQAYNVVVYLNGAYQGLYTLADHINDYLMEDFGYDQAGNLYKARDYDANWRRTSGVYFDAAGEALPKNTLHDGFTKEEGMPEDGMPGAFDDLDAFVAWAADSSDADFARTIDSMIARKEYEDWWIWVSYINAGDSAGKNSYHYRDPLRADSVWHCVPWDLNASFGQDWQTLRNAADGSPPDAWFKHVNNLFFRILEDPTLGPALEQRYGEELHGPFAPEVVLELFDSYVAEIEQSARRDEQKWQEQYRSYMLWQSRTDFTTFQEEIAYVRQWIIDRHAFIDTLY